MTDQWIWHWNPTDHLIWNQSLPDHLTLQHAGRSSSHASLLIQGQIQKLFQEGSRVKMKRVQPKILKVYGGRPEYESDQKGGLNPWTLAPPPPSVSPCLVAIYGFPSWYKNWLLHNCAETTILCLFFLFRVFI